jgi:hypothetical protein
MFNSIFTVGVRGRPEMVRTPPHNARAGRICRIVPAARRGGRLHNAPLPPTPAVVQTPNWYFLDGIGGNLNDFLFKSAPKNPIPDQNGPPAGGTNVRQTRRRRHECEAGWMILAGI